MNNMQVISRAEAKAAGLTRYFTGKPCKNGHLSARVASNAQCLECARLYQFSVRSRDPAAYNSKYRARRASNSDKINAQRRVRRAASVEKYQALGRADYAAHAEKRRAGANARRLANLDEFRSQDRARYAASLEKRRESNRKYRESNREALKSYRRAKYAENPVPAMAYAKLRRSAKKQAVPPWFSELDALVWDESADLIERRRAATGIDWHADHMIPLRSKTVCGLHTWNNCQVIPASLNLRKKNKLILTDPGEWVGFTAVRS